MSRTKLIDIIAEIKQLDSRYDKAAHWLSIKIRDMGGYDISKETTGYKYGAYSYEAWTEVAYIMGKLGIDFGDDEIKAVEKFVDILKRFKLLYLEW